MQKQVKTVFSRSQGFPESITIFFRKVFIIVTEVGNEKFLNQRKIPRLFSIDRRSFQHIRSYTLFQDASRTVRTNTLKKNYCETDNFRVPKPLLNVANERYDNEKLIGVPQEVL